MQNFYSSKEKLTKPQDFIRRDKLNIVLFDYETIDNIVSECLPNADRSEFQVHYHSLQVHIEKNGSEVIITIPLAFYNFDQEVGYSSVEMEMKDVKREADKASLLIDDKYRELFSKFPIIQHLQHMGFDCSYKVSNNGSIHRHPGDFSFSSIDYDKDPKEPGVVYRQLKAEDLYQVDSVLYLGEDTPKLVCTETRIVNVQPAKDGGIEGEYVEIPTYSFITKDNIESRVESILGALEDTNIFDKYKTTKSMQRKVEQYPLLVEILKAFMISDYRPDISNVDGKRIKQERTYSYTQKKTKKKDPLKTQWGYAQGYGNESWDDYVDSCHDFLIDDEDEEEVETTTIYDNEYYYDTQWEAWLPMKCREMDDNELTIYLQDQGVI